MKYPEVKVKLTGEDGNAFSIIGRATRAMRKANLSQAQIDEYTNEASSGDYDHLLQTTVAYFNCK